VSKLHYFAANKHTKYKPIRCELEDDDKYRVKNSFIGIVCQPGVQQAAAVCTDLPYDAGIFVFHATMPSYWNKSSQQQMA